MASLSSFVNSSQYSKENFSFPFIAGMKLGSAYSTPLLGVSGATNNPGGLFGWLIYARTQISSPVKGTTADTYIYYDNPYDFVGDLNLLSGVTNCILYPGLTGSTFSFFYKNSTTTISPVTNGNDFLHALNYFAYGGALVVAGTVGGLSDYILDTGNYFDVVVDQKLDSTVAQWLIDQPYTIGIYPTIADGSGITGAGNTLADFATLFGNASFVTGTTVANRIFNVRGTKTITDLDTSTVANNTKLTYTIQTTNDVAGFFGRAKSRNETYLTVAGLDRATILNGNVTDAIEWTSSLKTYFRNNKVNFFVNYNPKFLGSDLVGATSDSDITADDRVGPSRMRADLTKVINNIGLKYVFDVNNQTTRDQVVSEVQTALDPFAPYLDTSKTQIICDSSNNQNNSSVLRIDLIVQPVLTTESFTINLSYTQ